MKRLAVALVLLGLAFLGTWARVQTALRHPSFDPAEPIGMLQSDPALLVYLTERVAGAGGLVPADWRADPRIAHPEEVDVPARFTVGLEWLVAWTDAALGHGLPLHVVCLWVAGALASLGAWGVYLAARELCANRGWGIYAALLWAILPANYRTIGFVLVREDLSLPLFALHLSCAARAARTGGAWAGGLAGLLLGLALATWHAAGMLAAVELGALFLLFLAGRGNPLAGRAGRAALGAYALVALGVPALFAKGALLAPCAQLALAMLAAAVAARRGARSPRAVALATLALAFAASALLGRLLGSGGDLLHVLQLLWAKLSHLGLRPEDPRHLGFAVRMMWQGPFETTRLVDLAWSFGFGLLAVPPLVLYACVLALRGRDSALERAAHLFLALAAVGAWWIVRALVLPGMLLPIVLARALQRSGSGARPLAPALGALALLALQLLSMVSFLGEHTLSWHSPPRRDALREMVAAVEAHVPAGEAVVADFMVSPALLAHTGRPVVLQPKWETADARARVERFWRAFYHGTPEGLRRLCVERWRSRYLLVDRFMLGTLHASRYLAGLRRGEPLPPGSVAEALLDAPDEPPAGYVELVRGKTFSLYALGE